MRPNSCLTSLMTVSIVMGGLLLFTTHRGHAQAQSLVYIQDWESGVGGWFSRHGPGDPVILVQDPLAPSPITVQQIARVDELGNYFSPAIPLKGGNTYCVASWIRWTSGGWPFVGIDNFDAIGGFLGENWLIGRAGYPTGYDDDDTVTPVPADRLDWGFYQKSLTLRPDASSVRLKNELWFAEGKGGDNLGFFDDLQISNGRCLCRAAIWVSERAQSPGTVVPVRIYIAHERDVTVTVTWELSVSDQSGEVVARRTAAPYTFEPGDVVNTEVGLPLPQDLEGGKYTIKLAVSGMAGTKGASTTFRVMRAE